MRLVDIREQTKPKVCLIVLLFKKTKAESNEATASNFSNFFIGQNSQQVTISFCCIESYPKSYLRLPFLFSSLETRCPAAASKVSRRQWPDAPIHPGTPAAFLSPVGSHPHQNAATP
jgi:hypothetical protein